MREIVKEGERGPGYESSVKVTNRQWERGVANGMTTGGICAKCADQMVLDTLCKIFPAPRLTHP